MPMSKQTQDSSSKSENDKHAAAILAPLVSQAPHSQFMSQRFIPPTSSTTAYVNVETSRPVQVAAPTAVSNSRTTSTDASEQSHRTDRPNPKYKATRFPTKLMMLLEDDSYSSIISWTPDGRKFTINKPDEFTSQVLHQFFKESKLSSFFRKLYRWGFKKSRESDQPTYYNPKFVRGNYNLCAQISCSKRNDESSPINEAIQRTRASQSALSNVPSQLLQQMNHPQLPQLDIQTRPVVNNPMISTNPLQNWQLYQMQQLLQQQQQQQQQLLQQQSQQNVAGPPELANILNNNGNRMLPNFHQQQYMNPMIQLNMQNAFQPVNTGYVNDHSSNAQILMMLAALQNNSNNNNTTTNTLQPRSQAPWNPPAASSTSDCIPPMLTHNLLSNLLMAQNSTVLPPPLVDANPIEEEASSMPYGPTFFQNYKK